MQRIIEYFWVNRAPSHAAVAIALMLISMCSLYGYLLVVSWFYSRAVTEYMIQDKNNEGKFLWITSLNFFAWPAWRQNKFLWAFIPATAIETIEKAYVLLH